MNLYLFEVKVHIKSLIFWSLGILMMVAGGMGKYAAFASTGQDIHAIFDQIPPMVINVLGFKGMEINEAVGFFGIVILYTTIMAAVHASMLGADLLSKEEKDHTAEFLMAKPLTRAQAITSKALAGVTHLFLFNIITYVLSLVILQVVAPNQIEVSSVTLLLISMFLIQMIFFSVGMMLSALNRTCRRAAGLASAFMLSTFMLSIFIDIYEDLHILNFLTPFKYFQITDVIENASLNLFYVLLSIVVIVGAMLTTYKAYQSRDLHL